MQMQRDVAPIHYAQPAVVKHDVFIYDDIGSAENYTDLIHALNNAQENEIFNIKIATGGGDLDGAIALIHALRTTQALTIGHADSIVASAGTIIFLSCKQWVINEFAYFMFHDGGGVTSGKFNETAKQIEAIRKLYNNIADKIYKPFFTEEEIAKIMDGSDLYQDATQMADRINAVFPEDVEIEDPELDSDIDISKEELLQE